MADVQPENGYTRIANELMEKILLHKFNATQLKIIIAIMRYTYGFNRKSHAISITFLMKAINSSKKNTAKELNELIKINVVSVSKDHTCSASRELAINKDYDTWCIPIEPLYTNKGTVHQLGDSLYTNRGTQPVHQLGDQERKNIKKTIKKDGEVKTKGKNDDVCINVVESFNAIAVDLPKVKVITDKRKSVIKAMVKEFGLESIIEAFEMAQDSDFLSCRCGGKFKPGFDWIMTKSNFVKVIEGNYANSGKRKKTTFESLGGIFANEQTRNDGLSDVDQIFLPFTIE